MSQEFWNEYAESTTPQVNKILVKWDTCDVGNYNSVEEAQEKLKSTIIYQMDKSDFRYKEFGSKEWKKLFD